MLSSSIKAAKYIKDLSPITPGKKQVTEGTVLDTKPFPPGWHRDPSGLEQPRMKNETAAPAVLTLDSIAGAGKCRQEGDGLRTHTQGCK